MSVETDSKECDYCPRVTDNLQTCMNHGGEAHWEILNVDDVCYLVTSSAMLRYDTVK